MTLSERFNRINFDKDRSSVIRRTPTNYTAGLTSDRLMEPARSYLYDDYMGNDLFENNIRPYKTKPKARGRFDDSIYDDNANFDVLDVDLNNSPLRRRPQRRSFGNERSRSGRFENGNERYVPAHPPRRRYRPPQPPIVQEVIEYYEPIRRPTPRARSKVVNVPIHHRISFKRLPRVRNFVAARRRAVTTSPIKKGRQFKGGRVNKANIQRVNRERPVRKPMRKQKSEKPQKSMEELDRELEAYMKGSKHPRIEPI